MGKHGKRQEYIGKHCQKADTVKRDFVCERLLEKKTSLHSQREARDKVEGQRTLYVFLSE